MSLCFKCGQACGNDCYANNTKNASFTIPKPQLIEGINKMKQPSEAAPASIINIAYESGVVVERARIVSLISKSLVETCEGTFNAFTVLTELLGQVAAGPVEFEDPKPGSHSCKGSCRKCKNEE